MSRPGVAALILLCSCGRVSGSGINAIVEYHVGSNVDACVKVRASPQTPAGQTKENSYALQGKPKDGSLKFGILVADDWKGDITVRASLHRPCASSVELASATSVEKVPASGAVVTRNLVLAEAEVDGGTLDAGADAGTEDAGGVDAGALDGGGLDAGADAGIDAGVDAGAGAYDAGRSCDGGMAYFTGPANMTATPWWDVALYPNGGVWLAGAGALHFLTPQGTWVSAHTSCGGEHKAAWARPDGRVYFGTVAFGLKSAEPNNSACVMYTTSANAGIVQGIAGFVDGGTTFIYSATSIGTILRQSDPETPLLNKRWDFDAGVTEFWTISGPSESALFAGGRNAQGGVLLKFDPATDSWNRQTISSGTVYDISAINPSLAFAGTDDEDLWLWDGNSWAKQPTKFGESIFGLQAFSATEVYGSGRRGIVRRWNGSSWTTVGAFDAGLPDPALYRIRGLNSCDLWSAGSNGSVVRSP